MSDEALKKNLSNYMLYMGYDIKLWGGEKAFKIYIHDRESGELIILHIGTGHHQITKEIEKAIKMADIKTQPSEPLQGPCPKCKKDNDISRCVVNLRLPRLNRIETSIMKLCDSCIEDYSGHAVTHSVRVMACDYSK